MSLSKVPFGELEAFNAVIEIPAGSQKKYAYDQDLDVMRLSRILYNGTKFPFNYGHVAQTKADDGDAVDVFVISTHPISRGTVVMVRPIGMVAVEDRGKNDHKILAIPLSEHRLQQYQTLDDLPAEFLNQLKQFYLEAAEQWEEEIKVKGFFGKEKAVKELLRTQVLE